MKCRRCGSTNVALNVINEMRVEKVHHKGMVYRYLGACIIYPKSYCPYCSEQYNEILFEPYRTT